MKHSLLLLGGGVPNRESELSPKDKLETTAITIRAMAKLNIKQRTFCEEYLVDLNATQAAIRAGYSKKTAKEIGYENLTKPHIAQHIQSLMGERSERTEITADRMLEELAKSI